MLGLLGLAVYALWIQLFSSLATHEERGQKNDLKKDGVIVDTVDTGAETSGSTGTSGDATSYMQYRQGLRRDLYEGRGAARRHAFYTAQQAETVWQEKKGEFEEHLTQCAGVLYEDTGELRIHSSKATCLSRPMALLMDSAECTRVQEGKGNMSVIAERATWRFPQEEGQPWVLETEKTKMRMRPQ